MDAVFRNLALSVITLPLTLASVGYADHPVITIVKPAKKTAQPPAAAQPATVSTAPSNAQPATTATQPVKVASANPGPADSSIPCTSGTVEWTRYSQDPGRFSPTLRTDDGSYYYLLTNYPAIGQQISSLIGSRRHVTMAGLIELRGTVPFLRVTQITFTPAPGLVPPPPPTPAVKEKPTVPPDPIPANTEPVLPPLPLPPHAKAKKPAKATTPTAPATSETKKPGTVDPIVVHGEKSCGRNVVA